MDLKKVDFVDGANSGFTLVVFDPATMVDTDISITVLGRDSDIYRQLAANQSRKRLGKMAKAGRVTAGTMSLDEFENDAMELLVACTTAWENISIDGVPVEYSKESARRVYKEYPFIKEQVEAAITDRANFSKG
jgi:hypothetical protein